MVSTNFNYTDSLLGSIPEPMQNGVVQTVSLGTFRNFLMGTNAYYQLLPSLAINGEVSHVVQTFLGQTYSSATQYGGGANYSKTQRFLKGSSSILQLGPLTMPTSSGDQGSGIFRYPQFQPEIRRLGDGCEFQIFARMCRRCS